jgi:superfamily I DNA and RNA helicase
MYYKATNLQSQVNTLNNEWIKQHRIDNPNDKITQRYTEIIKVFEFEYVLKDNITEKYITDYIEIVNELPEKPIWHDENCSIQIVQSNNDCLAMLDNYPEIAVYRKENNIESIRENGFVYIYVNYLLEEHRILLENFNAIINNKIEIDKDNILT